VISEQIYFRSVHTASSRIAAMSFVSYGRAGLPRTSGYSAGRTTSRWSAKSNSSSHWDWLGLKHHWIFPQHSVFLGAASLHSNFHAWKGDI